MDRQMQAVPEAEVEAARAYGRRAEGRNIDGWRLIFSFTLEQEFVRLPVRPDYLFVTVFTKLLRDPQRFRRRLRRVAGADDQWSFQIGATMRTLFTLDDEAKELILLKTLKKQLGFWERISGVVTGVVAIPRIIWLMLRSPRSRKRTSIR